jgi:citrate lyase subunit beta / citryl-CoA lyase
MAEAVMKLRRSMLFVPGDNSAMLSTSFVYKPDSIMFDLEDAVAPGEKDSARLMVFQALQHPAYRDIETVVRVNALNTAFGMSDLEASVRGGADIVRVPKTENAGAIHEFETHLARIERDSGRPVGDTKLMAAIESASGVINAVAIARASPRMIAIAIAGFDYLVDMGTKRNGGSQPELFYARAAVLHAARAARIDAFDVAYGDVNDDEGFLREVGIAKQLGFNGKSLIHPRQVELLHKAYAPTVEEQIRAKRVLAAAEAARRNGLGVVSLDGEMVDPPVIKEAETALELAKAS